MKEIDALLHVAVRSESYEQLEDIIAKGANVNCLDEDDCSPLYWALCIGCANSAAILLHYGADPKLGGNNLEPLEIARLQDDDELISLMKCYLAPIEKRILMEDGCMDEMSEEPDKAFCVAL
ncbi:hypothetical protein QZJ86_11250 [Methylomonas montana]|uniref:ankyrin repeat domain-containing protein n=1 Tax=Methylomonas montana TaxID=3058963 RepID=UPI00265ACAF1|nr:ankyrin repeat domain-containing protein [Methylomonas montana]WKJ88602.1 hypothetical protein QZJ86_11250 [Methylomonas montana]